MLGCSFTSLLMRIGIAVLLAGCARLATAHPAPFSYIDLYLEAESGRGTIVLHDFDIAHELQLASPAELREPGVPLKYRAALTALLDSRLRLRIDGAVVRPSWGRLEVLAQRQSVLLSFELVEPVRGRLEIEGQLFPYDATHQTFVNIYEGGTLKQQSILDQRHTAATFYSGDAQGRRAVVRTFVQSGMHHILIGPDHVLFLLGLLLLGGSWWRLAAIVTAFTVGHSITLSLAALGVVQLSPALVEPIIALSIIVVGVDTLLVHRQRRSLPAGTARDLRTWMAAGFGLIHGFGFATVLLELGLPREALGWSLAAFNAGVEIGQLCIVVAALGLGHLARRLPAYRPVHAERFLTVASLAVIAAGVYWLALRVGLMPSA